VTISERIFELLEQQGISKIELAQGTGINLDKITTWQNNSINPMSDEIAPICNFLGISEHWLLTGDEPASENSINGNITGSAFVHGENNGVVMIKCYHKHSLSKMEVELLDLFKNLSVDDQYKVYSLAKTLNKKNTEPGNGSDK
jgi:transcriptional regulator with XRE-family HTH domain